MTFETKGALRMVEVDDWHQGCLAEGGFSVYVDYPISGETLPEIVEKIQNMTGAERDGVQVNACDEPGRIDVQLTENADGLPATAQELALWKKGKAKLFAVTYSFLFEEVTRSPAVFA